MENSIHGPNREEGTVKPTESELSTDGGEIGSEGPAAPFKTVSTQPINRRERYALFIREWLIAPFLIIWGDWRARLGGFIILFYVLMGTVGVRIVDEPRVGEGPRFAQPFQTWAHPLGTDLNGNDLLAQTVHATPPMLEMIAAGAVFTTVLATAVGTLSGYKGGFVDRVLMTLTDILLTIPGLPLVIVLALVLDPRQPWVVGVILTINAWAGLARAIRSQVLTIRETAYIEASRLMGIPTRHILLKDITPGLMPYILVNFVNSARTIIFASVALYFLGILPDTFLNWGVMMNYAYSLGGALYTPATAHWLFVPLVTIVILSFGLILFAQGTDRVFNPRVRARHMHGSGGAEEDEEHSGEVATQIRS